MAAGDLVVADWQFEYRGVLFGDGSDIDVVSVTGLDSLPGIRTADIRRPRTHGSLPGNRYADTAVLTFELELGGDDFASTVDDLVGATGDIDTIDPLVYQLPGQSKRLIFCRPSRRDIPVGLPYLFGLAPATVQFDAADPLIYSADEHSDSTGVGSVTGGLSFPLVFPLAFGEATPGVIAAPNAGSAPAPWTAVLTGPLVSPSIEHVGQGRALTMSGFSLEDGQTLVFDSRDRTVLLGGTASRSGSLTRREWFDLLPGSNTVQLDAASGSGQLQLTWRDAWL